MIGLGNIGFQFDFDRKRSKTWSHVSAYRKNNRTRLAAVVEIDEAKVTKFRQYVTGIPVYKTVDSLFKNEDIDIISVCTPTTTHYEIVRRICRYPVKAIFCEKPLSSGVSRAAKMIRMCKENKIILAVNHIRRWDSAYLFAERFIKDGKIGKIKAVNLFYSGQVFNIGTHLFDAVRMIVQKDAEAVSGVSGNSKIADPSISGWIAFGGGIICTLGTVDRREDLLFEIDAIGDKGRIRILENGAKIEWYTFNESRNYSGYQELVPKRFDHPKDNDSLVDAVGNICDVVSGKNTDINCSGQDGLEALRISASLAMSAKNGGRVVRLRREDAK